MPRLTKRVVDALNPQAKRYSERCSDLAGFEVRVSPSGKKVFNAQIRVGRRKPRVTIGAYGAFTVEQARKRAEDIIRGAAEGRDPQREKQEARQAITVAELCELYMEAARAGLVMTRFKRPKRPATIEIDEGRISRHIKPLIGAILARDLRRADLQRLADDIAKGKTAATIKTKARGKAVITGGAGTAARVVELLGGIYSWGEKRDLVSGSNPARGVEKARGDAKDRVLNADELRALGNVLDSRGRDQAARALRLIALAGMRRGEACALREGEIDELGQCLRLNNTKTGRSTRPVGKAAIDLLRSIDRREGTEYVFARGDGQGSADLKKRIADLFDAAGLHDVRAHDLRRTFASVAADLGYTDATIAELLGHARRGVTERHYVRRSDPVLLAAADRVSSYIAAMLDGSEAEVVQLRSGSSV